MRLYPLCLPDQTLFHLLLLRSPVLFFKPRHLAALAQANSFQLIQVTGKTVFPSSWYGFIILLFWLRLPFVPCGPDAKLVFPDFSFCPGLWI